MCGASWLFSRCPLGTILCCVGLWSHWLLVQLHYGLPSTVFAVFIFLLKKICEPGNGGLGGAGYTSTRVFLHGVVV